jgi:hypothetical protein
LAKHVLSSRDPFIERAARVLRAADQINTCP